MEKRVPILTLFAQYAHIVFVVLSLLYALLWLPFSIQDLYLDPSLNPHIVDLARIVSLSMCLSILVFCTHNRSFQIRFSAVDVLLGMLWGYIFVSSVWIAHNDGITPEIVELVALIGLYAILRTLDTYSKWISLVVLVLCGFLQAVYGLMQLYGIYASNHGLFKMTGTFLNPGPFGGYMALCFSLTFALYRFRKQ
ncbi:MAG: hypothetical protein RIS47_1119, partial [Bacteroidota bacterium]